MGKRNYGREVWGKMIDFVEEDDGLVVEECGSWSLEKLFFFCNYTAQFTQAMAGNPHFSSVNYVDLFASCGVCVIENQTKRYPGSALIASGCTKPFDNMFFVEQNEEKITALETRIQRLAPPSKLHFYHGDANETIESVANAIPKRSLILAFIDPYSLAVHFDTIKYLANQRQLDLLILFADDMDILRNVKAYYLPGRSNKLDMFLGENSNWRDIYNSMHTHDAFALRTMFAQIYQKQLKSIGYHYFETMPIPQSGRPLYRLIYASRHKLGLKFWRIALRENLGGDRTLWGE